MSLQAIHYSGGYFPLYTLHKFVAALFLFILGASPAPVRGAEAMKELQAAIEALRRAAVVGPQKVQLGKYASINLPQDTAFIPEAEATQYLRALGKTIGSGFIGLLVSRRTDSFIIVGFTQEGYIKDAAAGNWDVDGLLEKLKEDARHGNAEREKRGIPAMEVEGWIEKPLYDADTHRLVWSLSTRAAGSGADETQTVNYNTCLLGREGYLSLNLVTDSANVGEEKVFAQHLLSKVSFNPGSRYEDFNPATDRVAEYGLAALVDGLAAKKLGLLAAIGDFFAKTWAIILVGFVAFGAIFVSRKLLKRREA